MFGTTFALGGATGLAEVLGLPRVERGTKGL